MRLWRNKNVAIQLAMPKPSTDALRFCFKKVVERGIGIFAEINYMFLATATELAVFAWRHFLPALVTALGDG